MATMEKLTHVSEINQLVSQGKEKGYLTYEEVNDVLPSDVVTPDQIDDLMALFSENEIAIVDTSIKGEKIASSKENKKEDAEEDAQVTKSDSVSIDDPVRLYLREMGTISLLTRKGEVEIAKRIESYLKIPPPVTLLDKAKLLPMLLEAAQFPPKLIGGAKAPCQEVVHLNNDVDLNQIPILQCWPSDAGRFITFPIVINRSDSASAAEFKGLADAVLKAVTQPV